VITLAGGWPALPPDGPRRSLGRPYSTIGRLASSAARDPFEVDPDKVDRGNQAHASTQDALADFLRNHGIEPRSPAIDEPEFDLAWEHSRAVFVAEVKSITEANEEQQLRLGLGQVLRYRQSLARGGRKVVAVLVAERAPIDRTWTELCRELTIPRQSRGISEREPLKGARGSAPRQDQRRPPLQLPDVVVFLARWQVPTSRRAAAYRAAGALRPPRRSHNSGCRGQNESRKCQTSGASPAKPGDLPKD
jgi:hypothetical protein